MYKKGQVEDFFADLIPAIVIVVLALILTAGADFMYSRSIKASFESDIAGLSSSDLNSLMRAPVEIVPLAERGLDKGADTFIITSEAANDPEEYAWLWSEGLLKGDDTVSCSETLQLFFDDYFSDYSAWNIMWVRDGVSVHCFRLAGTSTTYESPETSEISSEVILPTDDPSKPVKVRFKGWFEVGQ